MKEYNVTRIQTIVSEFYVKADSQEEAEELVRNKVNSDEGLEPDTSDESEDWSVTTEDDGEDDAAAEAARKWQSARAIGELTGVPRGRTGIGLKLTGGRTAGIPGDPASRSYYPDRGPVIFR